MSRREALLSMLGIFAVALVARIFFASQIVFPKPEDTAYYVAVARNLLDGRGLVFDGLWSYGTPPLEVPRAAFEVWLPLSGWNGKFQGVGNGANAGAISYDAMATAVRRGYAVASTDTSRGPRKPDPNSAIAPALK